MAHRAISPVVGVALMIVLTLLLATFISVAFVDITDLGEESDQLDDVLDSSGTSSNSDQDLLPVKNDGEEPRTSGDDVLEFRIENTRDEEVTVEAIEIEADDIDSTMSVDDGNADEIEIRRVDQTGKANRDTAPGDFDADGTEYALVGDSNNGGQEAIIGENASDAEIDIRRFSTDIGTLENTDSAGSADLRITLVLADGSDQDFYFTQK